MPSLYDCDYQSVSNVILFEIVKISPVLRSVIPAGDMAASFRSRLVAEFHEKPFESVAFLFANRAEITEFASFLIRVVFATYAIRAHVAMGATRFRFLHAAFCDPGGRKIEIL